AAASPRGGAGRTRGRLGQNALLGPCGRAGTCRSLSGRTDGHSVVSAAGYRNIVVATPLGVDPGACRRRLVRGQRRKYGLHCPAPASWVRLGGEGELFPHDTVCRRQRIADARPTTDC